MEALGALTAPRALVGQGEAVEDLRDAGTSLPARAGGAAGRGARGVGHRELGRARRRARRHGAAGLGAGGPTGRPAQAAGRATSRSCGRSRPISTTRATSSAPPRRCPCTAAGSYYRLRRIEEVAGVNLHDGEDRLLCHLALRLARLSSDQTRAEGAAAAPSSCTRDAAQRLGRGRDLDRAAAVGDLLDGVGDGDHAALHAGDGDAGLGRAAASLGSAASSSPTSHATSPAATPAPTARRQTWSTTRAVLPWRRRGRPPWRRRGRAVALLGERDDRGDEVFGAIGFGEAGHGQPGIGTLPQAGWR